MTEVFSVDADERKDGEEYDDLEEVGQGEPFLHAVGVEPACHGWALPGTAALGFHEEAEDGDGDHKGSAADKGDRDVVERDVVDFEHHDE